MHKMVKKLNLNEQHQLIEILKENGVEIKESIKDTLKGIKDEDTAEFAAKAILQMCLTNIKNDIVKALDRIKTRYYKAYKISITEAWAAKRNDMDTFIPFIEELTADKILEFCRANDEERYSVDSILMLRKLDIHDIYANFIDIVGFMAKEKGFKSFSEIDKFDTMTEINNWIESEVDGRD